MQYIHGDTTFQNRSVDFTMNPTSFRTFILLYKVSQYLHLDRAVPYIYGENKYVKLMDIIKFAIGICITTNLLLLLARIIGIDRHYSFSSA